MRVKINGIFFEHFIVNSLDLGFDTVASTFNITVPFDPSNPSHRSLFRPFGYRSVFFYDDNDDLTLAGTAVNQSFVSNASVTEATLTGYSFSGILEDCT